MATVGSIDAHCHWKHWYTYIRSVFCYNPSCDWLRMLRISRSAHARFIQPMICHCWFKNANCACLGQPAHARRLALTCAVRISRKTGFTQIRYHVLFIRAEILMPTVNISVYPHTEKSKYMTCRFKAFILMHYWDILVDYFLWIFNF